MLGVYGFSGGKGYRYIGLWILGCLVVEAIGLNWKMGCYGFRVLPFYWEIGLMVFG